jgi:hypothetical protein
MREPRRDARALPHLRRGLPALRAGVPGAVERGSLTAAAAFAEPSFTFDVLDEHVSVSVDDDGEHQRPAADGTVFNELLAPPGGRIEPDRVQLAAAGAHVFDVVLDRQSLRRRAMR